MTGTAVASSYITTIEDFETRLTGDPRTAAIALLAAESASQTWYLQKATAAIDLLPFIGYKCESDQVLQHPRKYVPNPEQDSPWGTTLSVDAYGFYYETAVHEKVKQATVEEAISLYTFFTDYDWQAREQKQDQGVTSASDPSGSESYNGAISRYGGLKSKKAYALLGDWIEMAPLIL